VKGRRTINPLWFAAVLVALVLALWMKRTERPPLPTPPAHPEVAPAEPPEPVMDAPPPVAPPPVAPSIPAGVHDDLRVPVELSAEIARTTNEAVGDAKDTCLVPWVEEQDQVVELVLDAVVSDGALIELDLRPLTELPDPVIDCVRDTLWDYDWPQDPEHRGEVRFQRSIHL